jgi:phenylpropionate dioxygenase-like ring-hydroxylating dioxygenase large terminal subunit
MASGEKQDIEARLASGLLGQWYVIGKSVQVKRDKPHAVAALGRNLVLWRDVSGRMHCLEDYCPHRGARLSRGEVNGDNISCRYHGVTLDGSGTIVRVPAMPGCALEGRKAVQSYAVIEANDGIFAYFPSSEQPNPSALNLPEEFSDPAWSSILCMGRWECSYRFVYDNFADPMHACYLHADSFTLAFGAKQDVVRVEPRAGGFHIARVEQKDVNLDWTDVVADGSQVFCRLDIPYPAAAGPGGPFRIIGYATPVDASSCMVFFWRLRQVRGIARQSWRFLYRARLEARHWQVLEQDREMLTNIPRDAHKREMLYQHDVGVARMRRMLAQQAKDQLPHPKAGEGRVGVAAEESVSLRTAV